MPPRGPRRPSIPHGQPRQYTTRPSENKDWTLSSSASELIIAGDSFLGGKILFREDIDSTKASSLEKLHANSSDEEVFISKDERKGFRPPVVQAPTPFRTTFMHKRESESALAVYLPEKYDGEKSLVPTRTRVMTEETPKRGTKFWLCIAALMTSSFLIVLDLTGLSTALPTIVNDLHGTEFEWVGSAYALASTAFLPLTGALAQTFGRKILFLVQLFLFALGSILCGAATDMSFLIASRTIQGIGAGGIASLTQIIISDLVPLRERGSFNGLIGLAYGLGTSMSPVVAGALTEHGKWRWFFFMNAPIAATAALLVFLFLDVRAPRMSLGQRLRALDWIGNLLIIISTTLIVLALTWGGVRYAWSSVMVALPLSLGLVLLVGFIFYEIHVPDHPVLPIQVLSNRTSLSGFSQAFFGNFIQTATIYYLPLYYQACKGRSPLGSGVDTLAISVGVMPFALSTGISIAKTGLYRPQLYIAWASLMLAAGLFSTLKATSGIGLGIIFQLITSVGLGILQAGPIFPILAPIDVSLSANALAFFMFVRFLSQTWGISIGGAVIQNVLENKLPNEIISLLPSGTSIVYSLVEVIPKLSEAQQEGARVAFSEALQSFWRVLIAIGALGLVASLFMKGLKLHTAMDDSFALQDNPVDSGERRNYSTVNDDDAWASFNSSSHYRELGGDERRDIWT